MNGVDIILDYFREIYEPVFRHRDAIYSSTLSRYVRRSEACFGGNKDLVERLLEAIDLPRIEGQPKRSSIPSFFKTWAPTAWCELLKSLKEGEEEKW